MKRTVQILASLLLALGWWPVTTWAQAPVLDEANAFITRWKGEAGKPIQVPLYGSYAYRWEKADGTEVKSGVATVADEGLLELPVAEAGEYVLRAGPAGVKRIEFGIWRGKYYDGDRGTPGALLRVEQWGSVAWESFAGAFLGCGNMNIAEGAGKPDLSRVTSMRSAFEDCKSFNSPIGAWDVSRVTSMREMFRGCRTFNQPLGAWDVSQVTSMRSMFYECTSFNQPLEKWDVSRVTDMEKMFRGCSTFNQPLEQWDVSKVTDMGRMFYECKSFNQPLGGWTLSALARDEERDHDLGLGVSGLDAANYSSTLVAWAAKRDQLQSGVRVRAEGLWHNATGEAARQQLMDDKGWSFSGDYLLAPIAPLDAVNAFITRWQGTAGETIGVPLYGQYSYEWVRVDGGAVVASGEVRVGETHLLELAVPADGEYVLKAGPAGVKRIEFGKWNGEWYNDSRGTPEALLRVEQWGSVAWESFAGAFYWCENMNVADGAGKPDLSGVASMQSAFWGCKSFNSPIGDWDVSRVTSMELMFRGCSAFNQPLETWDVSKVTDMSAMFSRCESFNQQLEKWDVSKVTDMWRMFYKCKSFNQPLEKWNVSGVTNMEDMFKACGSFNQPLGGWTLSALKRDEKRDHDLGFQGSGLDATNYSSTLVAWAAKRDQLKDGVKVAAAGLKYDAVSKSARQQLIDGKAWVFKDDSEATVASPAVEIVDAPTWLAVGATHAFSAKVVPAEAPQAVTWSVEGDGATFTDNVLKVTKKRIITVTATSEAVATSKRSVQIRVIAPVVLTGIAVNPTRARIAIGDTQALAVGYTPADATNRAVTWSSSDASVATVSEEGLVMGKGEGTAKITVTSVDGGHTATCAVTVVAPVALTGIAVNPSRARIAIGDTQALAVRYTPADATNKAVTWSSSDEDVATVDAEGLVTAKGKGTATITATAADGGHRATCAVTVVAPVALTGITVMPTSAQLKVGLTQQLALGYTPADATNRAVTWSSSDASVATVDAQGKVTGVKTGSATITVTSVDGGHTATCSVTVVADEKPSGVESVALACVTVSPNPFGDHLTVRGAEGVVRYSLVSATGVVVLEGAHAGGGELMLATSHLPTGIYWLRLVAEDGERVVQVVRR